METYLALSDSPSSEIREKISQLYEESFGLGLDQMEILPQTRFYLAMKEDQIVAIIALSDQIPSSLTETEKSLTGKFLYSLCTRESYRRQGIMKRFLTYLFSLFPKMDFYLEVESTNQEAHQMYAYLLFFLLSSREERGKKIDLLRRLGDLQ